jgi:hypothetical protein
VHYIWNLKGGEITFYVEGREMREEDEIGSVLANYIMALNRSEEQIAALQKVIKEAEVHNDELTDYFEEYGEEEDYEAKYKVEDVKDALFHAMMKKDEKLIGKYLNQLTVLAEKHPQKLNEPSES